MLGMNFLSFLLLTVIGGVVALLYHLALRTRFPERIDVLFGRMIIGWLGAWLGSPVLGHWLWKYENIYILPAILGAICAIHLDVLAWRALARVVARRPMAAEEEPLKKVIAA